MKFAPPSVDEPPAMSCPFHQVVPTRIPPFLEARAQGEAWSHVAGVGPTRRRLLPTQFSLIEALRRAVLKALRK